MMIRVMRKGRGVSTIVSFEPFDNFLGFDELSVEELKELDEIEQNMDKGKKISLNEII